MENDRELLSEAYRDFNARRIDELIARLHPEVIWPNGMQGGYVHGHGGVRDYWTRQWAIVDPHVEPLQIERDTAGRFVVKVHQVVRDLEGNQIADTIVHHSYQISDGLITRMDIE